MNITICENLKELRKQKGNTQEELAEHLGISMQAVSKWERCEGYPDITLIPALALYYNVTADKLLGMEENVINAKIQEYIEKDNEIRKQNYISIGKKLIPLWREAQKEFPNNLTVLYRLLIALSTERTENFKEIIQLGERLLRESTDNKKIDRYDIIQGLCYTCIANNDIENAKKYAKMAPHHQISKEMLYGFCLGGEESIKYNQKSIMDFISTIHFFIYEAMCKKGNLTTEEKIKAYEFDIKLHELLYSDGDFGLAEYSLGSIYFKLSCCESLIGNTDRALADFEKMAGHYIKFYKYSEFKHTSFMINKLTYNGYEMSKEHKMSKNHLQEEVTIILQDIEKESAFDCVRNDEKYIAAIEKIQTLLQ